MNGIAVSLHKITHDREPRSSHDSRKPTGLMFHIVAGAILVVVMVFAALYVIAF
ncbi:hypothetical protein [Reyranella sp. CPCC 100927]|uniref:hypothetical protein n=1 Tax=Reyranella sp. CPCC 100927 TaxID=2599616 RepID=UPI0015B5E443|nr:hypothetical protein [Reyranella sp. CPCC 100927]